MKVFGNLMNRIAEGPQAVEPAFDMGCTMTLYSDRHAGTVVAVPAKDRILVQEDTAIRTDSNGMSDSQTYRYEKNPRGKLFVFRKDGAGRWREAILNPETNRWKFVLGGRGLMLGERDHYHDFDF